LVNKHYI